MNERLIELIEEHGWRMFPLVPDAKTPIFKGWQAKATSDGTQIARWGRGFSRANWGVVCGAASGIVVVDVDPRNGGDASYLKIQGDLPPTLRVRTAGGGFHLYYKHPGGHVGGRGNIRPGIDIKADGGYVVGIGSTLADGGAYELVEDILLADLPPWLHAELKTKPTPAIPASQSSSISTGQRNDQLFRELSGLRARGFSDDALLGTAEARNGDCEVPLDQVEVESLVRSVSRYPTGKIRYDLTDLGNARRLVAQHGEDLRYCFPWSCWLVWDGRVWRKDETGEVMRLAKSTVSSIYVEASQETDDARRRELGRHATTSQSQPRLTAMIELAKSETNVPALPDELDSDKWILNVENGVVDLRSGTLRPHERSDLMTRCAPVEWDPTAKCPKFTRFLLQVSGSRREQVRFLQRVVGYCLTGSTREQKLFFFYGAGANGKSTFLEAIRALLGEYAMQTPTQTLMARRGDSIPNDIARLKGARFASAVENEEGARLAESLVKQLTGGDRITARFMRAEFFEYLPQFKIIMAGNHKPDVRGSDKGIWRRICLVPFDTTIPEAVQDKDLQQKLKDELPGILNWAIAGCLAWQKSGLAVPMRIEKATKSYREETDDFMAFLENRCTLEKSHYSFAADILDAYREWSGDKQYSHARLRRQLESRGFESQRRSQGVIWKGLRVDTAL